MGWLRVGWKASGLVLLTLGLLLVWNVGRLFHRGELPARRWAATIAHWWARGVARVIRLRLHVTGKPPEAPALLVANHLGYLDIIALMATMPARFVAKVEVASWPVMGWLARTFGTLFIDRRRKRDVLRMHEIFEASLAKGDCIVFFPEGTSSAGSAVLPFKASLMEPMARLGQPVAYAVLRFATPPGAPPAATTVCWWGDMSFGDHLIGLLQLRYIDAWVDFGPDTMQANDRKVLARDLQAAIEARFVPTTPPETVPAS